MFACFACAWALSSCSGQQPSDAAASDESGDDAAAEESWDDLDEGDIEGEPSPPGLEPDDEALAKRLDSFLERNFPASHMPGAAVAIVDADGVRYMKTLGTCDSDDDAFYIGSLSKSFTALCIMQLVEAGKVDLDAPASDYAPQYAPASQVSVRMLLNQTSGFGYYDALSDAAVGDTFGEFSYSNANYDLLGRIVEGASGESYASYVQEHVFDPLGMADSSATGARSAAGGSDGTSSADADVLGHRNYFGVYVDDGFEHGEGDVLWGGPSSGYVASSVRDMARYLQMYLRAGDGLLSPDGVSQMFWSSVPDPYGDTYYGMGWTIFTWDDGETVLSHDGDVETNVASMCLLPERGLGIVVLGDGYDDIAGNAQFFELANDVISISTGAIPTDLSAHAYDDAHRDDNLQWALFLLVCAVPLAFIRPWKRLAKDIIAQRDVFRAFALGLVDALVFLGAPALILSTPYRWGIPWRDVLTFYPTLSCGLIAAAGLLAIAAIWHIVSMAIIVRDRCCKTG